MVTLLIHRFTCLSMYASIHLLIYLHFTHVLPHYFTQSSICSFIQLSPHQPLYLSTNLSPTHISIHSSTGINPSFNLPIHFCPFTYPSIRPSTHLPAISLPFPSIHIAIIFCPPTHLLLSIPFIHLSVYPYMELSTCPLIHSPSTYLLFPQFKHLSICPPTYPSMHPIVLTHQSIYPLFVHLSTHPVITHNAFISLYTPTLSRPFIYSFTS